MANNFFLPPQITPFTTYKPVKLNHIQITPFGEIDVGEHGLYVADNGESRVIPKDKNTDTNNASLDWSLPYSGNLSTPITPIYSGSLSDKENYMKTYFSSKYNKYVVAGIMGNLFAESEFDNNVKGDGGKATGLAQWHPDRYKALEKWAKENSLDPKAFETQVQYVTHEIETKYPKLHQKLQNLENDYSSLRSKDAESLRLQEATRLIMDEYETPAVTVNKNKYGTAKAKMEHRNELNKRLKYAGKYL